MDENSGDFSAESAAASLDDSSIDELEELSVNGTGNY